MHRIGRALFRLGSRVAAGESGYGCVGLVAMMAMLLPWQISHAVPSFARQTGMACEACHTVWPELTHFGRTFKAGGYVLDNLRQVRGVDSQKAEFLDLATTPPLSIMIQAGYTQLAKAIPDTSNPAVKGSSQNGTVDFPQQVGLFYAGKVAPHLGAFLQLTYDNGSGTLGIDNTDIRLADLLVLPNEKTLIYGLSLNNNPTVQDLWNSTPAFGFPYVGSSAAVAPVAGTQIDGGLAQSVAGLSAYVFWQEAVYAELGFYRSAKQGSSNALTGGTGPLDGTSSNIVKGFAPYGRVAYEYNADRHSLEVGMYGAAFRLFPGGTAAAPMPVNGPVNEFRDIAEDLQYQYFGENNSVSVVATHIHETMNLDASYRAGSVANARDDLTTERLAISYFYQHRLGGSFALFSTSGSSDAGLYAAIPADTSGNPGVVTSLNNRPDTSGSIVELDYLPWLNTKFGIQYTAYNKFNGGSTNYDGAGRSAQNNNSLYFLVWLAY